MIWFIVIAWLCVWGAIGALIGDAKNLGRGSAALICMLLGPIGLLFVALLPKAPSEARNVRAS